MPSHLQGHLQAREGYRAELRTEFLHANNCRGLEIIPLAPDASFRSYFRIKSAGQTFLLMDAPPSHEEIEPYIKVARHLHHLGMQAPKIYAYDTTNGFILLEDFGNNTFTRLLDTGYDEAKLYEKAIDVLCRLHNHRSATHINLPPYDHQALVNEALLFVDWYYPALTGSMPSVELRESFITAWGKVISSLPSTSPTLVLRDFHVDNMMLIENSDQCGLLDFQDALLGPPAYDLVSLLEDTRRDLTPGISDDMREQYFSRINIDRDNFDLWYTTLGVQRHCKVAGIFVRLAVRDGKRDYLDHIPRVLNLLESHLELAHLQPIKHWLADYFPNWNSKSCYDWLDRIR